MTPKEKEKVLLIQKNYGKQKYKWALPVGMSIKVKEEKKNYRKIL